MKTIRNLLFSFFLVLVFCAVSFSQPYPTSCSMSVNKYNFVIPWYQPSVTGTLSFSYSDYSSLTLGGIDNININGSPIPLPPNNYYPSTVNFSVSQPGTYTIVADFRYGSNYTYERPSVTITVTRQSSSTLTSQSDRTSNGDSEDLKHTSSTNLISAGTYIQWHLQVKTIANSGYVRATASVLPDGASLIQEGNTNNIWIVQNGSTTLSSDASENVYTQAYLFEAEGEAHAIASLTW